jgi:hypothetical protein
MAMFLHLTDEKYRNGILRNGIKPSRIHNDELSRGVFCMPVIPDFYATHQWLRELKRFHAGHIMISVLFRLPDTDPVFCGKYTEPFAKTTASKAHAAFLALDDPLGFQVIVSRKILPAELCGIRRAPQVVGWRYYPQAHEKPRCLCPACLGRGEYNSRNLKHRKLEHLLKALRSALDTGQDVIRLLDEIGDLMNMTWTPEARDETLFNRLLTSGDSQVVAASIGVLSRFCGNRYRQVFFDYFQRAKDQVVAEAALHALMRLKGEAILHEIDPRHCSQEAQLQLAQFKTWYEDD